MPSDTVWVALISGSVTVSATVGALWVQARSTRRSERERADREDRHRAQDAVQRVRERNYPQKEALYKTLLKQASGIDSGLITLGVALSSHYGRVGPNPPEGPTPQMHVWSPEEEDAFRNLIDNMTKVVDSAVETFRSVAIDAYVTAYDESVITAANSFATQAATETVMIRHDPTDFARIAWQATEVAAAQATLRAAVRCDLDYGAPESST